MPHRVMTIRGVAPSQNRRVVPRTGAKRTESSGCPVCTGPRISSLLQVEDLRGRPQVLEHPIGSGAPGQSGGFGLQVVQVAEDQGQGRAGLHTGGHIISLPADLAALGPGLFTGTLEPMAAKVARLGHTRRAHSNVRVEGLVQVTRPAGCPPVELDDPVGTSLDAEATP